MTAITTKAEAKVFKGRLGTRRRYRLCLFVGGIDTGLHWHLKRREVKLQSKLLMDNAAEILEHYGLMEQVFEQVAKAQALTGDYNLAPTEEQPEEKVLVGAGAPVSEPIPAGTGFSPTNMPRVGQRVRLISDLGTIHAGTEGTVSRIDDWLPGVKSESQFPVRVALPHPTGDTPIIPLNLHEIEAA